jgi:hypothetical protein
VGCRTAMWRPDKVKEQAVAKHETFWSAII